METHTQSDIIQTATVEGLLNRLTSRHIGERVAAMDGLRALGPAAVNGLLAYLREEGRQREKKKQLFTVLLTGGLTLAAMLAMLLIFTGNEQFLGLLGTFGALGALANLLALSQKQIVAVNVLAQMDDPRTLGPLIEGLSVPYPIIQTACAGAIQRIAPHIQAEDAAALNTTHFAALHRYLTNCNPEREAAFICTILGLVETLEDVSALPVVTKLAARAVDQHEVHEAAVRCTETLETCMARNMTVETLLRPTTSPSASPDTLLRAAQATREQTEPQQLLRASTGEAIE
jgi:hypothetical protein